MVSLSQPKRGDVWLGQLDPTVGREIQKTRPCLIVSPDLLNRRLQTVAGAPLTTGSHPARFRPAGTFAGREGLILCDQLRTLSHQRLIKHLGRIDEQTLEDVLTVLQEMFSP